MYIIDKIFENNYSFYLYNVIAFQSCYIKHMFLIGKNISIDTIDVIIFFYLQEKLLLCQNYHLYYDTQNIS